MYISEGEKPADALGGAQRGDDTSGSSTSASAADWDPLRDRPSGIFPDNDKAGKAYADEVAAILRGDRLQGVRDRRCRARAPA